MQTRGKHTPFSLDTYVRRMDNFSNYMISRPADGAVDSADNLMMGLGTARPFEAHGQAPVDIESILMNRGVIVGKHGHDAPSFGNTRMNPAGMSENIAGFSIPRLEMPARDTKSAAMPAHPGMPVEDVMPVPEIEYSVGFSSRQAVRDAFADN
jgi:hypothetical protein